MLNPTAPGDCGAHRGRAAMLRVGRHLRLAVLWSTSALLIFAVAAQATTGSDALNRPPIFKVSATQAKPFLGGYTSTSHGSGILSSTVRTGYDPQGYLEGTISVTQYSENQPATFLATLYEYRRSGSKMLVDLWTPDLGSDRIGLLSVRPAAAGGLTGTLKLGQAATRVTFKRIDASAAQSEITSGTVGSKDPALIPSTENAGVFNTAVVAAQSLNSDTNPNGPGNTAAG